MTDDISSKTDQIMQAMTQSAFWIKSGAGMMKPDDWKKYAPDPIEPEAATKIKAMAQICQGIRALMPDLNDAWEDQRIESDDMIVKIVQQVILRYTKWGKKHKKRRQEAWKKKIQVSAELFKTIPAPFQRTCASLTPYLSDAYGIKPIPIYTPQYRPSAILTDDIKDETEPNGGQE